MKLKAIPKALSSGVPEHFQCKAGQHIFDKAGQNLGKSWTKINRKVGKIKYNTSYHTAMN